MAAEDREDRLSRKVGLRPEDLVMFERGDLKLSMGHVFAISIALEEPLTGFLPNLLDVDALEDCGNLITLRRHVREAVATTDDTTSLKRALQELKSGHAGTGFFLERSAEAVHNLD